MVGFQLLAAAEIDGELHQLVETTATVVGCWGCGARALSKGRRKVRVRDLPAGGRRVVVVWWKRLWALC
jgi:DNA-directed RNA polymerase subunit RPC12/RpoP